MEEAKGDAWFYPTASEKLLLSLGPANGENTEKSNSYLAKNLPSPLMCHQRSETNWKESPHATNGISDS